MKSSYIIVILSIFIYYNVSFGTQKRKNQTSTNEPQKKQKTITAQQLYPTSLFKDPTKRGKNNININPTNPIKVHKVSSVQNIQNEKIISTVHQPSTNTNQQLTNKSNNNPLDYSEFNLTKDDLENWIKCLD